MEAATVPGDPWLTDAVDGLTPAFDPPASAATPVVLVATGHADRGRSVAGVVAGCGADPVVVADLAALLDAAAASPATLVIEDRFDGLSADRVVAFLRAAGSAMPVVVLGRDATRASRTDGLAPVEVLPATFDPRLLRYALRWAIAEQRAGADPPPDVSAPRCAPARPGRTGRRR